MRSYNKLHLGIVLVLFCAALYSGHTVSAQTAAEITQKMKETLLQREKIQKEIDALSSSLNASTLQAQTYANELKRLDLTQKKLEASLRLTSNNLSQTTLTLEELYEDIAIAEKAIETHSTSIARTIADMNMAEAETPLEQFVSHKSLSSAFDYINALRTIEGRVQLELRDVRETRMELGVKRDQAIAEKAKLESYKKSLSDQTKVIEYNKDEKEKLEAEARQSAALYKTQLEAKKKEREAFEKELADYESKLKITLDPNAIPGARSGVLSWPFETDFLAGCLGKKKALGNIVCITQTFGNTAFSRATNIYKNGHNGIDFGANTGTKVLAALSGVVTDVENTTAKKGCQYGYWVLVRHANGLSTLYAHLSLVSVRPGDAVTTGTVLGYSGNTGLSTGPHLHFGVYASAGIRIVKAEELGAKTSCRGIKTVAATPQAYLNPLAYLPNF